MWIMLINNNYLLALDINIPVIIVFHLFQVFVSFVSRHIKESPHSAVINS